MNFKKKTKLQRSEKKQMKKNIFKNLYALFDSRERVLDEFESEIVPIKIEGTRFSNFAMRYKVSDHLTLKIVSPKQMLKRLPIGFEQVKVGNTSSQTINQSFR